MEASRSLTSSRSHTPSVPASNNAALTGALLAFNKPAVPSSSSTTTTSTHHAVTRPSNGTLSASKSLYTTSTTAAPAALTPAHSGSSSYFAFLQERSSRGHNELTPDESGPVTRAASPSSTLSRTTSFTAATLAAARHQGSTPSRTLPRAQPTITPLPLDARALALQRRLDERKVARELSFTMDERPDRTSIEPTKSLVSLFEQQSATPGAVKPALSRQISLAKGKPPPILAPKPTRALSVQSVSPELQNKPDVAAKPKPLLPKKPNQNGTALSKDISATASSAERMTTKTQTPKPDVPAPRRASKRPSTDTHNADTASAPPAQLSRFGLPLPTSNRLTPRPPSVPPNARVTPSNRQRTSPTYKDTSLNMLTPHMTGDSLANAMVGAHLAFRSPSPARRARTPPPVPGPRRKQHVNGIDMLQGGRARSLSPQKKQPGKLLATLRADEADEKHKNRKHHFRQPNKHHEGTRERWRDHVSDSERKRYEGVWAANKGLYISSSANADEVLNLVVRDIWSRSRLPPEKLGKVWDLVAVDEEAESGENGQKRRSLTREQFVVGLWLIDQVLKGRNLPHNVNASVWTSVRLMGVKVRLEGKGKDGRKLERGTAW